MIVSTARLRAGFFAASAAAVLSTTNAFAQNTPKPQTAPPAKTTVPAAKPAVKLPPNVVARVGGRDITRDEVLAIFDMYNGRPVVGQIVQAVALQQEAKRLKVTVTEAELKKGVQELKDNIVSAEMNQRGNALSFAQIAARDGYTEDLMRYSVHLDILRRKTFAKSVESELPSINNQVKLAHILVATFPIPTSPQEQPKPFTAEEQKKKDEEAKAKADSILADIKAGKITFAGAAKQYSDDKSNAEEGGMLPMAGPGFFDPAFEKAGFAIAKKGDIVGPIRSQFGFHLIQLAERGKDMTAADKAKYRQEQIAQQMGNQQAANNWLNGLLTKSAITVNPTAKLVPNAKSPARALDPVPAKKVGAK